MQTQNRIRIVLLFLLIVFTLTPINGLSAQEDPFVVVLDAGHGGGDSGNIGNGYREKQIVLNVVLEVGKALEKNPNIKVIYTRKTDVFVELFERADIANKADADLFVSVHCNAHHSQASGTETFVLGQKNTGRNFEVAKRENEVIFLEDNYQTNYAGFDPSSPESTIGIGIEQEVYVEQSIILARKIEDNFVNKAKRKSRGLKQASLLVLRSTYMPSVLVELGFLTNNQEGAFLNSKNGQHQVAKAVMDAILEYRNVLQQNVGSHIATSTNIIESKPEIKPADDVVFKVQIAASSKNLTPKSYNFNGLSDISKNKVGEIYRYFYGNTSNYNSILKLQSEAKLKGFSSCFIVAYKDGKQIDLSEAVR